MEIAVSEPTKDHPTAELIMEVGEAIVDVAVSNETLRDFPIVGWAFKIAKSLDDVRSRMLTKKITKFLNEPSLIAAVEAREMSGRLLSNDEHAREVGETLLMVLDNATDMSKPRLLGKAYAAYLDGAIDRFALTMIAHVISISFIEDLDLFDQSRSELISNDTFWKDRLASSGLFAPYFSGALNSGGTGPTGFNFTPLGNTYLSVLIHADQATQRHQSHFS
jgi:hypothetical protein